MDHKTICHWLGLPSTAWPPDHYTLLGLQPGESDVARIEQHVHERYMRLRCYQLSSPELATEAMNRLTQAFVCLTDPAAKKGYDAALNVTASAAAKPQAMTAPAPAAKPPNAPTSPANGQTAVQTPPPPAPAPPLSAALLETTVGLTETHVDWKVAAPPVRGPVQETAPQAAPDVQPVVPPVKEQPAPAPAAPSVPTQQPADPFIEAARTSRTARRGLGTRKALYDRILATRELLKVLDQAGKYVSRPRRLLAKPAEGAELTRRLMRLDELLVEFPPLLGQPGQPGYRMLMLARDEDIPAMFKSLQETEREALALDWKVARAVLQSHLHYLRREVHKLRRQGWFGVLWRPVYVALCDYAGWVVLLLLAVLLGMLYFSI